MLCFVMLPAALVLTKAIITFGIFFFVSAVMYAAKLMHDFILSM